MLSKVEARISFFWSAVIGGGGARMTIFLSYLKFRSPCILQVYVVRGLAEHYTTADRADKFTLQSAANGGGV